MNINLLFHYLNIAIYTHYPPFYNWLDGVYTPYADQSGLFAGCQVDYRIVLEAHDSPDALDIHPPQRPVFAETALGEGPCYFEPDRLYAANTEPFRQKAELDLHTRTLRANLGGVFAESREMFLYGFFRPVLHRFVFPFSRLQPLHAAVLAREGRGVVLLGDSGMGKTTLALKLMDAGYALVSDDCPLLTLHGDRVYALSSLDNPRITAETLRLFPHLEPLLQPDFLVSGKHAVSRLKLPAHQVCLSPVEPYVLIQLQRRGCSSPRLFPVEKQALVETLLNQHLLLFRHPAFRRGGLPFVSSSRFVFEAITRLVASAPGFVLEYADGHLNRIPALLENIEEMHPCPAP